MRYATFTVRGQGRTNNEDCLRVLPEAGLFMVADGMGGHLAGEVASQIAVEAMADYLPDECKGMTEHLSEVKEPASMIKTLLRHARIQIEQAAKAHEHAPRQQVLSEAR